MMPLYRRIYFDKKVFFALLQEALDRAQAGIMQALVKHKNNFWKKKKLLSEQRFVHAKD
jgi:hypothetical protein